MNYKIIESTSEGTQTHYTDAVDLAELQVGGSYSMQANVTNVAPSAKTFDSGESQVATLTFADKAATGDGDYIVIYDTAGEPWAVAADKTGTSPEPTGDLWVSIPSAQKAQADINAATDAASVAAAFETAFDGLTDVPFATDDSAANGTMLITITARGLCDDPVPHDDDDAGAGSITFSVDNAGVASEVDTDNSTVTIPSHGYALGVKTRLTSTGTLPSGVTTGTDYFLIIVDENTVAFASSYANAVAGTKITLTNQGTDGAVNTVTATALAGASLTLQVSNNGVDYADEGSPTSITTTAPIFITKGNPEWRYLRGKFLLTAGQISSTNIVFIKNNVD